MDSKRCPCCKKTKPLDEFGLDRRRKDGHNNYCRVCSNAKSADYRARMGNKEYSQYQMTYRKSTPERRAKAAQWRRSAHFKSSFGLTLEEWQQMKEAQGNRCAICCNHFQSDKATHVDHDHDTGVVRGILCHHCNAGLGLFGDSIEALSRAVDYLVIHKSRKVA